MSKLIILDGTYGVGKSVVAHCLCELSSGEYICIEPDEKYINEFTYYFSRGGWPIQSNRAMLAEIRKQVEEKIPKNNIVITLTLNSYDYKQMWVNSLRDLADFNHVVLIAEKKQIISRISADEKRDKQLAMENLDGNLKYYQGNIEGAIKIDTTSMTPYMVANKILEVV